MFVAPRMLALLKRSSPSSCGSVAALARQCCCTSSLSSTTITTTTAAPVAPCTWGVPQGRHERMFCTSRRASLREQRARRWEQRKATGGHQRTSNGTKPHSPMYASTCPYPPCLTRVTATTTTVTITTSISNGVITR